MLPVIPDVGLELDEDASDPDNVEELVHGSAPWWEAHLDNPIHSIVVF